MVYLIYVMKIMGTVASQITSLTIVYITVYSDADQSKHQSSASLAFVWVFTGTGEFPAQRASYAENVSIWWRHHALRLIRSAAHNEALLQIWHEPWTSGGIMHTTFCHVFREQKLNLFPGSIWQKASIVPDNGLTPFWAQASFWNNVEYCLWRHMAS